MNYMSNNVRCCSKAINECGGNNSIVCTFRMLFADENIWFQDFGVFGVQILCIVTNNNRWNKDEKYFFLLFNNSMNACVMPFKLAIIHHINFW